MTTTLTPTLELAEKLTAVAEHLRKHQHLVTVDVDARTVDSDFSMQIAVYRHLGETGGVQALLDWAESFENPVINLRWHDEKERTVRVSVEAELGGYRTYVWDVEGGDLHRWRTGSKYNVTPISVDQLAAYVAAGTVEGPGAA